MALGALLQPCRRALSTVQVDLGVGFLAYSEVVHLYGWLYDRSAGRLSA